MFDSLMLKKEVKTFLKNELTKKKDSGTYLFFGEKGIDIFKLALEFTMGLNCTKKIEGYCENCEVCKKIKHKNYADLEIIELLDSETAIKIDRIKQLIYKAYSTSYEGRKKVFIIKDIGTLNKYSANALLKILEEPPKGTFFILISNTLNVLPTILSRAIVLKIHKPSFNKFKVKENVYDFFMGNAKDIIEWKENKLNLDSLRPYSNFGDDLKKNILEKDLESKINLLKSLDDYMSQINIIKKPQKLSLLSDILSVLQDNTVITNRAHERKILEELMYLFLIKQKSSKHTEKMVEIKQMLKYNVNTQVAFTLFFLT